MSDSTLVYVPLALIWGGMFAAGGFVWLAKRLDRRAEARRPIEPECGCKHHFAFHSPKTGQCEYMDKRPTRWERDRKLDDKKAYFQLSAADRERLECVPVTWELVQCTCQRYTGPEVLATIVAPEIAPGSVTEISPPTGQTMVG